VSLFEGKHPRFILAKTLQDALWEYAGSWGFSSPAAVEASGTFAVAEVDRLPRGVQPTVAGDAPRTSQSWRSFNLADFAAPEEPLGGASNARAAARASWAEVHDAESKRLGIVR
jgi:hypothetical protein